MTLPPPTSTLFPYTTLFRSLTHEVLAIVMEHKAVNWASVEIDKPHALRYAESVSVCLEARRETHKELRSEEHTSELQSRPHLVCRLLLEKKKQDTTTIAVRT